MPGVRQDRRPIARPVEKSTETAAVYLYPIARPADSSVLLRPSWRLAASSAMARARRIACSVSALGPFV